MTIHGEGPAHKAGRTPPAALPVLPENIPLELREQDHWVVWRYEWDGKRWRKPPISPATGREVDVTGRTSLCSFREAYAAYQAGPWPGVGFALHPSGGAETVVGIDLDKCRDPTTGAVASWAQEIVTTLATYTEVSTSSTGLRPLLLGRLPGKHRKHGGYEQYEDDHYVTITGHALPGLPTTLQYRQAELDEVNRRIWTDEAPPQTPRTAPVPAGVLGDGELLARAFAARNGARVRALWDGDTRGYGSPSEADLALVRLLAFWTGPDPERLDALLRASPLYRDKWDERHFADGRTYGQATVDRALSSYRGTYYTGVPAPPVSPHLCL